MVNRYENVLIETVTRLLIPAMQLFGLYVIAHGHGSPGGGFQGGCILAASFILMVISYDIKELKSRMSENLNTILCAIGVFIYGGTGLLCVILGGNFLDYSVLHKILPVDPIKARYMGMLMVEIGVGIAVMSVMISIFLNIASRGEHEGALN
ncbi:MAG: Na(+)/H(+) antiporter subunit B [Thermodesulfovibrionales bacterium]|nr:Na(+)/H(+) antiporter subunit B [Thermodesulfovibrionales bacterium]